MAKSGGAFGKPAGPPGAEDFAWKSQPAIKRIKEAVSEIKKVARKDKLLAAEGSVLFLEKVSPALEHVDSSSGSIGTAVNNAIAALVDIIAAAPADDKTRDAWLERIWEAYQEDGIPYIELLGDYWGELCVSKATASRWADQLVGTCKMGREHDATAVVDTKFRVRGIGHLRVIDASIMPTITSGNTNTPTVMIAERASTILRAERS